MEDRDAEFLRDLRAGHPAAFAQVVKTYTPRLRRMAMGYFRSPFEQEDAVQEAFVHLFKQRLQIDPFRADGFPGFVSTLARRRMIDLFRARRPADAELPPEQPDEEGGPAQAAENQQLKALLEGFEERLKPDFRAYFHRVFVDGEDEALARTALGIGRLRAKYVKKVLLGRLREHRPLLEFLGRGRG